MTKVEQQFEFSEFSGEFVDDDVTVPMRISVLPAATSTGRLRCSTRTGTPRSGMTPSILIETRSKTF
jgi:hypothetical protein